MNYFRIADDPGGSNRNAQYGHFCEQRVCRSHLWQALTVIRSLMLIFRGRRPARRKIVAELNHGDSTALMDRNGVPGCECAATNSFGEEFGSLIYTVIFASFAAFAFIVREVDGRIVAKKWQAVP